MPATPATAAAPAASAFRQLIGGMVRGLTWTIDNELSGQGLCFSKLSSNAYPSVQPPSALVMALLRNVEALTFPRDGDLQTAKVTNYSTVIVAKVLQSAKICEQNPFLLIMVVESDGAVTFVVQELNHLGDTGAIRRVDLTHRDHSDDVLEITATITDATKSETVFEFERV